MNLDLSQFLIVQLFAVLMIFTRVGSGLMVMPGIGEGYVSTRVRLLLALMISLAMAPALSKMLPPVPTSPAALLVLVTAEIMVGLTIGTVARYLVAIMSIAGSIISYQAGLSLATQFDYSQSSQGTMIGNFMGMMAVVVLFSLDLHLVMIKGLSDSYTLFMPGDFPPVDDLAAYVASLLGHIFTIGFQLAAPVVIVGLLIYLGTGILAKLVPAMQVFNVFQPAQILIALVVWLASLGALYAAFTDRFETLFGEFLESGPPATD